MQGSTTFRPGGSTGLPGAIVLAARSGGGAVQLKCDAIPREARPSPAVVMCSRSWQPRWADLLRRPQRKERCFAGAETGVRNALSTPALTKYWLGSVNKVTTHHRCCSIRAHRCGP